MSLNLITPAESLLLLKATYSQVLGIKMWALLRCMLSLFSYVPLCDPMDPTGQAPLSMDSPDKNTGLGSHYLLQGDNIIKRLIQGIFLKTNKKTNYKKVINC